MGLERLTAYVRGDIENDPVFREQQLPAFAAGLYGLGAAEIILAAFIWIEFPLLAVFALGLGALGLLTVAAARIKAVARRGRLIALVSTWTATLLLSTGPGHDYVAATVAGLLLAAAGCVPLLPFQALALGAGAHALSTAFAPAPVSRHVFFLMVTALLTVISLARSAQRSAAFHAQRQAVAEAEVLSGAQLRAQLSENAVSVGRLAAALTHEVNSPLGALSSAVDTLLSVSERRATAAPEEQERLAEMQGELLQSVNSSAERLHKVIERLERFADVEQSDLQAAAVNDLLADAALRLDEETRRKGEIDFQFSGAPVVICRPHQLTTVFRNLLSNALNALDQPGKVIVATGKQNHGIQITIRDNGRGMTAEQLDHIFDPSFRVQGDRVGTGNWTLFSTRQIVYEHGGDIIIDSTERQGTTVRVLLPG